MRRLPRRTCPRSGAGQALILIVLALPLFFAVCAVVVDGTNLMVNKRQMQNAADASALAAGQELAAAVAAVEACLPGDTACIDAARASYTDDVAGVAGDYSELNGGPDTLHECADPSDTNCYTWPYKGTYGLVEVRLQRPVTGFFATLAGVTDIFDVGARAVAATKPVLAEDVTPGVTDPGSTEVLTFPGPVHTTTDPDTPLAGGGVGFAMSRMCNAISYTGAGSDGTPIGAFATNGGLTFAGFGNAKKVGALYYNLTGCPSNPARPPSGTSACMHTSWGDASTSNNLCAKLLVDLGVNNTLPINWPFPPPALPTPKTGPGATTWVASTDYPSQCILLGTSGTISITGNGWASTHSPGIYCVSGSSTILQFGGGSMGADVSSGDGYTFFALNGAKIQTAGNTTVAKYYWPSACGARPETWADGRPASYDCAAWGRTLWTSRGYDPQTLFYATSEARDNGGCNGNAICLNGQGGNLNGDVFAPKPDVFPPSPTQTGGGVFISGGGLSAGRGFIESWLITIQGNTGSYQGTGSTVVIPGGTHTTTDPGTTTTIIHPGTTIDGSTNTTTVGTSVGLDE